MEISAILVISMQFYETNFFQFVKSVKKVRELSVREQSVRGRTAQLGFMLAKKKITSVHETHIPIY